MLEKRKIKRFAVRVPAELKVNGLDQPPRTTNYLTRDISSSGAFLITDNPLPIGTKVGVQFFIGGKPEQPDTQLSTRLKTTGRVIRTSLEGMALFFDRQCQIHAS